MARAPDYFVTVCDNCLQASCWHGVFRCWKSRSAGTRDILASELDRAGREHRSYYSVKRLTAVNGFAPEKVRVPA